MVKRGVPRRTSSNKCSTKRSLNHFSFRELSLLEQDRDTLAPPEPQAAGPVQSSVQSQPEPSSPGENPAGIPDQVYLHAAAIFQYTHQEKAAVHQLISYGKRSEVTMPMIKNEASQHLAYKLAFNTLKYQELLEDIMIDSRFYPSQSLPEDLMSLVVVMLYDFQDRKFLPREQLAGQSDEEVEPAVREVEGCLLRFKTKLAASLARCRIKHNLLTIDYILPENVRQRQERASNLPLYAWVNTLNTSMEEVCDVLKSAGFSQANSVGQLDGQTFCQDSHCLDLLVFPACVRGDLYKTSLLSDYRLIIQDKPCCVGPWALGSLLEQDGDVLMAGCFSACTVAHTAAIITSAHSHTRVHTHTFSNSVRNTHGSAQVFVCVGECACAEKDELQELLSSMGCTNVKLLYEVFHAVDVCDTRLQKVQLVLLTPQCSLSAVSNPVDYLLQENRDTELLQDLSQGFFSQSRLHTLVSQQKRDLQHALHFPKVQVVVYSTCSSFSEENEEVVNKALSLIEQEGSKLQPFRLSCPALLQCTKTEEEEGCEEQSNFFRLEASNQSNGCFLAVLARQPEPEVTETAQEILARATATGLLGGIQPSQPVKKEGRGRQARKGAASKGRPAHMRPSASLSSQSRLEEFLNREMKAGSSAPTLAHQRTNGACSPQGKAKPTNQHSSKPISLNLGSASSPALTSSQPSKSLTRSFGKMSFTYNRRASVPVALPPAPPKGRQEVLRPVTLTFPPVMFPGLTSPSVFNNRKPPPLRLNPTLTYLQWRNKPPPISPLPHSWSSSSFNHPRPWF